MAQTNSNVEENIGADLRAFFELLPQRIKDREDISQLMDVREDFDRLLFSDDLVTFLNAELTKARDDQDYAPALGPERCLTMLNTELHNLFLSFLPALTRERSQELRIVSGLTGHHIIGCVAGGPITLVTYVQDRPEPRDVFDRERKLRRCGELILKPGESAVFAAGRDAFTTVESGDALILRLSIADSWRLRWDYDRDSGEPLRAVAADLVDSRTDFAARMLGHIGNTQSLAILGDLVQHPAHYVRWSALKSIAILAPDKAMPFFRQAQNDTHPHIRDAAQSTIALNESAGF